MRILKKYAFLFIGIIFLISSSCKKYPDGPALSIETKAYRIAGRVSKTWNIEYFSINGNDSTIYFKSPYYGKYQFHRKRDGKANFAFISNHPDVFDGSWDFANSKNDIAFTLASSNVNPKNIMPPNNTFIILWDIQRLTEKDLWLETTYNGREYYMKLKH